MNVPLLITSVIVASAVALGLLSRQKQQKNLESWGVANRTFGGLLLWVLAAGEMFTTFTFLGVAGFSYTQGGPAYYVVLYVVVASPVAFFVLPRLWRYAKRKSLVTLADFFTERFKSRKLGGLAAVIGVAFVIPYVELQMIGLGTIVESTTDGLVTQRQAMVVALVLIAVFVYFAGLRATAWTAVLKDTLILFAAVVVGLGLIIKHFGGFAGVTAALADKHPGHAALPGGSGTLGVGWMATVCVLMGLGAYMFPHLATATFAAKSEHAIRRNATFMPLYFLLLMIMIFAGFTALLVIPGLTGAQTNGSILQLIKAGEPSWIVGVVGGAGALAAMVPSSAYVLSMALLLSRNLFKGLLRPTASEQTEFRLARMLVFALCILSFGLALSQSTLLANFSLISYDGISQFFPAVFLALFWRRTSTAGVTAGLVVGVGMVVWFLVEHMDPVLGMKSGFVALVPNALVIVVVSCLIPDRQSEAGQDRELIPARQSSATG